MTAAFLSTSGHLISQRSDRRTLRRVASDDLLGHLVRGRIELERDLGASARLRPACKRTAELLYGVSEQLSDGGLANAPAPLCVKSDSDWRALDVAIDRAARGAVSTGGRAALRATGAAARARVCAAERMSIVDAGVGAARRRFKAGVLGTQATAREDLRSQLAGDESAARAFAALALSLRWRLELCRVDVRSEPWPRARTSTRCD